MSSLYKSYTGTVSSYDGLGGVFYSGQIFTTDVGFYLTSVKIKAYSRFGTPLNGTLKIRAVSGGLPTGADLASVALPTITDSDTAGLVYEAVLSSPLLLSAGTKYAIIVTDTADSGLRWKLNGSGGDSDQYFVASTDSGSSWTNYSPDIHWFECWGTPATEPPVVQTDAVSDILDVSAVGNGEVTDVGVDDVDERGFVISTSSHGDPGDIAPADSDYEGYVNETGDFSAEAFSLALDSLDPSTTYYVRAYAHNSDGYAYGDEVSFDTLATPPFRFENIPGVVFDEADKQTIFAERLNNMLERIEALEAE